MIITEPERICEYEEIEAACNQLLVYLYRKNNDMRVSTRDNIVGLDKVMSKIKWWCYCRTEPEIDYDTARN